MTAPRRSAPSRRAGVASPFTVNVRGVSFVGDYPHNLLEMARQVDEDGAELGFALMADTNNPVDALAVAIICTDTGERVGHLPADVGNRLSPLLTAGEKWVVQGRVVISPTDPLKPGLRVRVCRAHEASSAFRAAPTADLEALYVRIGGLGEAGVTTLHDRWARSRLAGTKVADLTTDQLRYAMSIVGALEHEARRAGVDLEVGRDIARAHLVELRNQHQGYG